MADKHTKRDLFTNLLVFATAAEADAWVIEGIEHEIELLDKRASQKSNPKREAEQRAMMLTVADAIDAAGEPVRATAIAEATDFSVQRVSALLRKMVLAGEVVRHEDKKVVTFTLA